jgi:glutamate 2,3-aminomutase
MIIIEPDSTSITSSAIAQRRAGELQDYMGEYHKARAEISTGFTAQNRIQTARERILSVLGGTERDWSNWKWHMHHRHLSIDTIAQILSLTGVEYETYQRAKVDSLVSISPYYLSLTDPQDPYCPIRLQALPQPEEYTSPPGMLDPSGELYSSPVPGWVQRYPDRGILLVNDIGACPVACRFCQRRHNLSPKEQETHNPIDIQGAIEYIRETPTIRDVLLTGGDAFTLSDSRLEMILCALRAIPHVEIIRLSTRLPVTLPQRVTPELCEMLSRYGLMGGHGALWVVTHFNHPIEVTPESAKACLMLMSHGMPILNQSVLLKGINDDKHIMMRLNQELVRVGVKPYYLLHCKSIDGATHFRTSLQSGMEIIQYLSGRTSGLALPYYVVSLPQGKGKVRLSTPEQLHETDTPGVWHVTSWEGDEGIYDER